jgi:hypothetical protein
VNGAVDWPLGTVTPGGVVTFPLLSCRLTTVSAEAADARLTVQLEVPAAVKLLGVQLRPLSPAGATRLICVDRVTPFKVPLTVAVALVETVPVDTLKVALFEPLGIVTLAGAVNWTELSDSVTSIEPTATAFKVAVQFVFWLLLREPETQVMLDNTGAVSVRPVVRVPPFRLAVIVGVSFAGIAVTLTVNEALDWPLRTVTLAGVVTFGLLSDRVTKVSAVAFAARLTVQVEDAAVVKVPGEQLNALSAAATRLIVAERPMLFSVPVTVAVSFVETVAVVTVNVLLMVLLAIVTLGGVFNWPELSARATTVAPAAA